MLVDRWAEIQRESDQSSPFQEKVFTGQTILKENLEKNMLSQLELLFSEGREKPFHPSARLLVLVFDNFIDFNNNFPWPLIEETIDDIQINFEMLYIGHHFDKLPPKAKNIIVGHVDDAEKQEALNLYGTIVRVLGEEVLEDLKKYGIAFIQISMVEDGGGGTGKCRPCWKHMRKREMEEFLLCNCRKYLQLKQLAETSQESSTELLRDLFAAGEAQTFTFLKAPSGSSKPAALSCTAEDLKGKTILLEIRALNVGCDLRLASLIQLYNTKKEAFNLEIISIPLVHRSSSSTLDVFEKFSRDIPWLVIQNPWAVPSAVKYFLMELFAPDELDADSANGIKIIESNGRIFTPSKPVMGLLDRWGAKAYPFTLQKIEELEKEEWNQMETMPTLEFLFNGLESVSDQVKEMMLHQKVVCLYGGRESENTMKEFTASIRNAFISVKDNIHIIYIPCFMKAQEESEVTDTITWSYPALEMSTLAQAEMEGMLLLNPSQHDAFRFWRRIALLEEEMLEMYNSDTEQISALKKIFQCWNNENPWMILMDGEGKTITESGRKIVWSCKGSMEDEAKGLIELLIKGSPEQRKEALYKLEQWPDDSDDSN